MIIVLWHMLTFLHVFPCRYCDHNLEGVLPLSNVLRGVRQRLWLGWHIPWRKLTSGLTSSALLGYAVSTSHLKFGNRGE
jgi:hypothetical protein